MSLFIPRLLVVIFTLNLLTACASLQTGSEKNIDISQRDAFLQRLNHWTVKGKIAFIGPDEKQSANFYWKQHPDSRELTLSTFLGVSLLQLTSDNNQHTLMVDGNTYRHDNLSELLAGASGLNLPVEAFQHWLKGIGYLSQDNIQTNSVSQLPERLTTQIDGQNWQVDYGNYRAVNGVLLPFKLNARQSDLIIKIAISQWRFN